MAKVESFELDHNLVKAPYVRPAGVEHNEKGSTVQKYDLRFCSRMKMRFRQQHCIRWSILATYLRDGLKVSSYFTDGLPCWILHDPWDEHDPQKRSYSIGENSAARP